MGYILARLQEPSTYAGAAGVLVALGVAMPPGLAQAITAAGIGVAGLAAVLMKERSAHAPVPATTDAPK